jgi:hypothetical protein
LTKKIIRLWKMNLVEVYKEDRVLCYMYMFLKYGMKNR